jgi:hypothetical protein
MNDDYNRRVYKADGDRKIFDNRVKYIIFFLTIATGMLTLWEKCGPLSSHQEQARHPAVSPDSLSHAPVIVHRKDPPSQRHHTVATPAKPGGVKTENKVPRQEDSGSTNSSKPVTLAAPLERAVADNTEFRLMRAEGNIHAQTIKMTLVLITSSANWHIMQDVRSIIDNEGNEYLLKSYTNGAVGFDPQIVLNTGVPIRCTYTFGGVLPTVGMIKLFKFQYWGKPVQAQFVEFRDIPIQWK